jgi:hypothetical protein
MSERERIPSGSSSIGRAPAFQAGGCGFETRLPLRNCEVILTPRETRESQCYRTGKERLVRAKNNPSASGLREQGIEKLVYHGWQALEVPKKEGLFACRYVCSFKKLVIRLREKSCCSSVVEHFLGKEEVGSSILLNSSKMLSLCF